jgi:hypothetical protein
VAKRLMKQADEEYRWRLSVYKQLATMSCDVAKTEEKVAV